MTVRTQQAKTAQPQPWADVQARDPARTAWIVLLSAFAVFCILTISVPWGLYRYVRHAVAPRTATVETISGTSGTVLVETGRLTQPVAGSTTVPEGTRIVTDEASRAFVQFFEGSNLQLATDSDVILRRMRAPRWRWSQAPDTLVVEIPRGRVTLGAAGAYFGIPLYYEVHSPHMTARLGEGSYRIDVAEDRTQVVAIEKSYSGASQAQVQAAGANVNLGPGQRTEIAAGQPPSPPMGATQNLLADSTFEQPLGQVWRPFHDAGGDGDDGVAGTVSIVSREGRQAVQFLRIGSKNSADVGIEQKINEELPDLITSLTLQAELKVLNQELAGGGIQSTEYPVIFRLKYKDAQGNDHVWYRGFYFKPGNATQNGVRVPQGKWYNYYSDNLLDPESGLDPAPAKIMAIEILASGHDYWSLVSLPLLLIE